MSISDRSASSHIGVWSSAWQWWKELARRDGRMKATRQLLMALAEFARDSTPERQRQRYGDAEYDWEHRVNTTSGAVGWRDRLLGVFHSPYQPTDSVLFHEMIAAASAQPDFDFREFTFIDLGSGKGRTLLMASSYPFRRILGLELLPALNQIARDNLAHYNNPCQKCFAMEAVCADATAFLFPSEPIILFLFNPFPERGLSSVMANLECSLLEQPRKVFVLYHNPLLAHVLDESAALKKIGETHQYAMYASR